MGLPTPDRAAHTERVLRSLRENEASYILADQASWHHGRTHRTGAPFPSGIWGTIHSGGSGFMGLPTPDIVEVIAH